MTKTLSFFREMYIDFSSKDTKVLEWHNFWYFHKELILFFSHDVIDNKIYKSKGETTSAKMECQTHPNSGWAERPVLPTPSLSPNPTSVKKKEKKFIRYEIYNYFLNNFVLNNMCISIIRIYVSLSIVLQGMN